MLRLARLVVVSVACLGLTSVPLLAQSQPASSDPPAQPVPQQQPASADQETPPQTTAPSQKAAARQDDHKPIAASRVHNAVLWQDPGDIASKNLFYGAGGEDGQPKAPFRFLDEDKHDSNPKFDARDADGRKWRVKLGAEAKPEVVASRLLWAVGYYTEDDYVLHIATVDGLQLKRTGGFVHAGNQVIDARFARKPDDESRIGAWQWKSNPFFGSREFNGLRVMMAVMNSWDLKDENNAVYKDKKTGQQIFLVSDIGATFATNSLRVKNVNDKGNVDKYKESKFITNTTDKEVDFGTPAPPTTVMMESGGVLAPLYIKRHGYDWIGDHVPRADARWIGSLLGQLSHQQLMDAFRAGNFTPQEIDEYVAVVESRIAQLKAL
jgi:hypothetical protein